MSNQAMQVAPAKRSIVEALSIKYGMEAAALEQTLMETVMPKGATKANVAALCVVANEYGLNPFLREIYAFPGKSGGIGIIVPVDGWSRIVNNQAQCDGFELIDVFDEESGEFVAVESRFYRKDRAHPTVIREYLTECYMDKDTWKRWPRRMLRHKAFIQGARMAFSLSGIMDEDEAERTIDVQASTAHIPEPTVKLTTTMNLGRARTAEPQDKAGGSSIAETVKGDTMFGEEKEQDPA